MKDLLVQYDDNDDDDICVQILNSSILSISCDRREQVMFHSKNEIAVSCNNVKVS